ncbi:AraD1 family protein [Runella salmonicolor]|uniref:GguC family protein n=1 Tax=Runella salmonicolor TaxID=2950278 RepID=A0ABT1FX20_9BACT|nr:AraD1 family protein [Runella salmonicolor]MCP1386316.1 GguC family protein [Runella salmonicolor]
MRLIQFINSDNQPRVGIVGEDKIQVLSDIYSVYDLFHDAVKNNLSLEERATELAGKQYVDYETLVKTNKLLPPLTHPDPYHTWISGTGLTHLGSAASRNAMHDKTHVTELTDSMKIFKMGVENGKMQAGIPASQPEWFFKGNGLMAVNPGEELTSPAFGMDGGEEPEMVGLYIVDAQGTPQRIGFAVGNEFSDHKMERINYLYLAHSKLRNCSYGPELLLGNLPESVTGTSRIIRDDKVFWEKEFLTGEAHMSHNLANLEHHHFKHKLFRQPGDVHVHFFGTSVLSFADAIETQEGDIFEITAEGFGKPLRNRLIIEK